MLPSFRLFGEIIYVYPMLAGLAWGVGVLLSRKLAPKKTKYLKVLLISLFFSSWLGAKIFFILTSTYIDKSVFLKSSNFWLGGGFVYYGGLIFGLMTLWAFVKITRQEIKDFEFMTIPLGIGHGLGRIGCFFAGCCHGEKVFDWEFLTHTPIQLVEAFGLFFIAYKCFEKLKKQQSLLIFYLSSYAVLRFILEFFRGDEIRGLYLGLSTSQLISAIILLSIYAVKQKRILK